MRNKLLLIFIFLVNIWRPLQAQEIITGLHYFDNSPIEVEIRAGKIAQVTRLEKLPESFPEVYIAPGFIDNQVNGFADVTFALGGGELTPEGVKHATKEL